MGENSEYAETFFCCESDQELTQVAREVVDSSSLQMQNPSDMVLRNLL